MVPVAILLLFLITLTFELAGLDVAANSLLAAVTATGFWVLTFFEEVTVLPVALLIVPVDIYSVFRGPTKVIVEQQPQVFDALSIAFLPRRAQLRPAGPPRCALLRAFLGATIVFTLRPPLLTWC